VTAKQPTVEAFLAALHHARISDIIRLRAALIASDRELGEKIKWNAPSFGHDGDDRVTFRLQPGDRFELVLHRGVQKRDDPFTFDDPEQLIAWATNDRGSITVPVEMSDEQQNGIVALANRWLAATR
jgi:hypothetical protein